MFSIICIVFGGTLAGGAVLYSFLFSGRLAGQISCTINAPPAKIYNYVMNLEKWRQWVAWLVYEPEILFLYGGSPWQPGTSMEWHARYMGAGKLTHRVLDKDRLIESQLYFIRPLFFSVYERWEFVPQGEKTEVRWSMSGRLPFFLRFMMKKIESMLAVDYRISLIRLNRLLDERADKFDLNFCDETERPDLKGLSRSYQGSLAKLMQRIKEDETKQADEAVLYLAVKAMDAQKGTIACDVFRAVEPEAGKQGGENYTGGKYLRTRFDSANYQFIDLALAAAVRYARIRKMKLDKNKPLLACLCKKMNTESLIEINLPCRP